MDNRLGGRLYPNGGAILDVEGSIFRYRRVVTDWKESGQKTESRERRLFRLHAGQDMADFGFLASLSVVPFLVGMARGRLWKALAAREAG